MKKTIFNFLLIAALAFAGTYTLSSCGSKAHDEAHEDTEHAEGHDSEKHEHDGEDHEHEGEESSGEALAYACPMHPEEKGKEGDTCSKCKMALEKIETGTEE
jgi:ABC-type Zn2+ transport system substrate-binding protein/surface adhesin